MHRQKVVSCQKCNSLFTLLLIFLHSASSFCVHLPFSVHLRQSNVLSLHLNTAILITTPQNHSSGLLQMSLFKDTLIKYGKIATSLLKIRAEIQCYTMICWIGEAQKSITWKQKSVLFHFEKQEINWFKNIPGRNTSKMVGNYQLCS